MQEYFKYFLIRTPLEKPAQKLRFLLKFGTRIQHPELQEIYLENQRIEQALKHILSKSSNCIDIGCHLGSILSEILKLSPEGHHIAFEPIPYKTHWLKQKFPEVDIKEMALSDTSGEVNFYINKKYSGFSGLHADKSQKHEQLKKITVQCEKLDDVLHPDRPIDFIKLDVEGGELAVLRGATKTLSCYHPILLFECTRSGLSSFGFTCEEIFEFLTQQSSYSILLLKDFLNQGEPLNLQKFNQALQYPFQAFNFIAVPHHF